MELELAMPGESLEVVVESEEPAVGADRLGGDQAVDRRGRNSFPAAGV